MGDNRLTALLSGAGDQGSRPDEPWDDAPMPLGYRASPLPTDALGPILGPLVRAIEDAYQVPADLPINLALPLITTAVRGQRIVRINRDWTEVLALATLSALASGERKSPVLRVLDTPLREFERAAQIEAAPRIAEQAGRRKIAEDRAEALKKQAVRAVGIDRLEADNSYIEAVRALEEDDLKVDPVPRLLVDDITPES
ncbi:MAG: DUF3987 domain-containing protein, partial [Pseudonocardiales bacterium]|nr:DUF3987 domain-containing protein [Pseudonocardiales bacterium]